MTITYPLTMPTTGHQARTLGRYSAVGVSRSPWTGKVQTQAYDDQHWTLDVTLPPLIRENAAPWQAFFAKLNGIQGTFLAGDVMGALPRGSARNVPGTPVVGGASQTGNTLAISGCPISNTGFLLAGDYLSIGTGVDTKLHVVVDDAATNGSGVVTATIWPSLRVSPANLAAVTLFQSKGVFRMISSPVDAVNAAGLYTGSFSAIETPSAA